MMVARVPASSTLRDVVIGLIHRRGPIPWLDWLPLAQTASEDPEALTTVFNQLSLEDQFDLINLLRRPDAGPLADALLIVLAGRAGEIADLQVRQFILEDAIQARDHQASALQMIRERLITRVESAKSRLQPDFDLAEEIISLERELAEIRSKEEDQDERFARVHELEMEILRLETRQRLLAHYDEKARKRDRDKLKAEVEALQAQKAELEEAIARVIGQRNGALEEVQKRERELHKNQRDLQTARERLAQLEHQAREAQESLKAVLAEQANLQNQQQEIARQIRQLEQDNKSRRNSLEGERKKLKELEIAAQRAGMVELEHKVREVYALLPDDLADQALRPGNR